MITVGAAAFASEPNETYVVIDSIRVKPEMRAAYRDYWRSGWLAVRQEAVKQGLILSYRIVEFPADSGLDYDYQLFTEFKSRAAIRDAEPTWQKIIKKVLPKGPKIPEGLKAEDVRTIVRSVIATQLASDK